MPLANERRLTVAARHLILATHRATRSLKVSVDVAIRCTRFVRTCRGSIAPGVAPEENPTYPKHLSRKLVFTIGSRNRFSPEQSTSTREKKQTTTTEKREGLLALPAFLFPARCLSNLRFAKLSVAPASRRRFFPCACNRAFHAVRVRAQHCCAPACHDVAPAQFRFFLDLLSLNTLQPPSSPANLPPIRSPPSLPLPPPPNPPPSKPTSPSSSARSSGAPLSSS